MGRKVECDSFACWLAVEFPLNLYRGPVDGVVHRNIGFRLFVHRFRLTFWSIKAFENTPLSMFLGSSVVWLCISLNIDRAMKLGAAAKSIMVFSWTLWKALLTGWAVFCWEEYCSTFIKSEQMNHVWIEKWKLKRPGSLRCDRVWLARRRGGGPWVLTEAHWKP